MELRSGAAYSAQRMAGLVLPDFRYGLLLGLDVWASWLDHQWLKQTLALLSSGPAQLVLAACSGPQRWGAAFGSLCELGLCPSPHGASLPSTALTLTQLVLAARSSTGAYALRLCTGPPAPRPASLACVSDCAEGHWEKPGQDAGCTDDGDHTGLP
uniref:cDNA FLJ59058 n=1 Tax=Homo sapiens TaxID=9606 RepID=B7Z776_HUMAN|nr:unnamed protein product [Homo sapiens]